jgi:hypothetical protein
MRCFYHQDKEAVGSCKSCGKALCVECAVDLAKGLACRNRCEERVHAIIELVDRNIERMKGTAKVQVVAPVPVQRPGAPGDFVAAQLTAHIRSTRQFWWISGAFYSLFGFSLVIAGLSQQLVFLDFLGLVSAAFGIFSLAKARRSSRQPKLSETRTR